MLPLPAHTDFPGLPGVPNMVVFMLRSWGRPLTEVRATASDGKLLGLWECDPTGLTPPRAEIALKPGAAVANWWGFDGGRAVWASDMSHAPSTWRLYMGDAGTAWRLTTASVVVHGEVCGVAGLAPSDPHAVPQLGLGWGATVEAYACERLQHLIATGRISYRRAAFAARSALQGTQH